jgi:hypothetical protein
MIPTFLPMMHKPEYAPSVDISSIILQPCMHNLLERQIISVALLPIVIFMDPHRRQSEGVKWRVKRG